MGRLLFGILAVGALGFLAYKQIYNSTPGNTEKSAPKQTLDGVREKAKGMEEDTVKRTDALLQKAAPAEP
ncbi:MAG: hypothetical protein K1X89_07080 [Myxococcaceae bacterium]|nr:hypothetical protein [Myxococcaceae bacterium]